MTPTLEPENIQQACQDPAYAMVLQDLVEKAHPEDIIAELVKSGKGGEEARRMVQHGRLLLNQALRRKTSGELLGGIVTLVVGVGITLLTFILASDAGGVVVICYGAIIVGFVQIIRALDHGGREARGRLRREVTAAIDYGRQPLRAAPVAEERRRERKKRTYDY